MFWDWQGEQLSSRSEQILSNISLVWYRYYLNEVIRSRLVSLHGKACESRVSSLTCLTCRNPDNTVRRWPKISCGASNKNTRNAERVKTQLLLPACVQHHQLVDVPVDRFQGVGLKWRDCFEARKQKERNILSSEYFCCMLHISCSVRYCKSSSQQCAESQTCWFKFMTVAGQPAAFMLAW